MKAFFFAVPFAMALVLTTGVRADDKAGEWTVSIGCAHCSFEKETGAGKCAAAAKTADGKVVLLKGDAMKGVKFKAGGDYTVKGKLSADGKTVEVSEIKAKA
jgi:hypothetical protein